MYVIGIIHDNLANSGLYNRILSSRFFISATAKYLIFDTYDEAKKFLDDNNDMILTDTCNDDDNDPFRILPSDLAVVKITDDDIRLYADDGILGYRVSEAQDDINMYFDTTISTDTYNNTEYCYTIVRNDPDNGYTFADISKFASENKDIKYAKIDRRLIPYLNTKYLAEKYI
jgi:hypothetical protein